MKKQILTAVSAIALLTGGVAFADDANRTSNQSNIETKSSAEFKQDVNKGWNNTKENVKEGWNNTKDAVSNTAKDVSNAAKNAYSDVEKAVTKDDTVEISGIAIDKRMTASGMLGEPVYNVNGDRVAKVRDIIVDREGNAMMVVLGDGDFTGLGKLVAFDYDVITERSAKGDVISSLTEDTIDMAASFSYESSTTGEDVRLMPSNGYSVADLLRADLVSESGEELANVDNISFRNGQADQLIVAFGGVLGLGSEQAAMPYDEPQTIKTNNRLAFKLDNSQAADFEAYKRTVLN